LIAVALIMLIAGGGGLWAMDFWGFSLLSTQTNCIESMDEIYPELKWLHPGEDGIELPSPKLIHPKNLLEGLEFPPQKPHKKWDFDE
jgi:hypothetical protein